MIYIMECIYPKDQLWYKIYGKHITYNIRTPSSLKSTACRAILHDKSIYGDDTDMFRPERFMKGNELDPDIPFPKAVFGVGRRICAGREFAEASLWITITSVLAVFNFEGDGQKSERDYGDFSTGVIQ
jgi:cytochrome P450